MNSNPAKRIPLAAGNHLVYRDLAIVLTSHPSHNRKRDSTSDDTRNYVRCGYRLIAYSASSKKASTSVMPAEMTGTRRSSML